MRRLPFAARTPGRRLLGGSVMLILTRRVNETICIGDDVTVTIVRVNGSKATLGIVAPREVPVHREEILKRIREEEGGDR